MKGGKIRKAFGVPFYHSEPKIVLVDQEKSGSRGLDEKCEGTKKYRLIVTK